MFQTDLLSIIRSLNTVFTAIGVCHASYVDSASEVRMEVLYQNKVEKQCISLAIIIILIFLFFLSFNNGPVAQRFAAILKILV